MNAILKHRLLFLFTSHIFFVVALHAQNNYRYTVDLNNVQDDQLTVELVCPKISTPQTTFYLPRIVPGTYMNSNYGKYVHDLKAFDKAGKELPVKKIADNSWELKNAKNIYRLKYKVEDTWDSEIRNQVYSMCGTNFEAGKNFVLNTPGLFGYFEGMKKNPFELSFTKPMNFYAATGLKPVSSSATTDVFLCENADVLYDSPIMFSLPDTTSIRVGNADVLVAVYSPKKKADSKFIAANLEKLLMGTKDYLGGKLPVDKYAFIFYFNGEQKKMAESGAWEHSYSSFYSLGEEPQEKAINGWVDISAHEFFHIVTPLTISSREVKEFNFNETHLSKHVWLYEGSTEYYAHHMQVWAGLRTPDQFLNTLSEKINFSRTYFNDSLSFTELSTESAGKWKGQYVNVYMKGALISACLDLYLLKLSGGQYSLKALKHDLGVKFGKDKYFNDAGLFDEIEKLTYPEIKEFLLDYVEGGTPIPYEKYFALAGVQYIPKEITSSVTLGAVSIAPNDEGKLIITTKQVNEFGKKMGYQDGDELLSINGTATNVNSIQQVIQQFTSVVKEGDKVEVTVKRKNASGETGTILLSAPAMKMEKTRLHVVRLDNNATPEQIKLRNAWLNSDYPVVKKIKADANDVSDIDKIIKALYEVISGPAGNRNWDRFRSLFHPEAYMGAMSPEKEFMKFSPEEYIKKNAPFFEKYSFMEKEIGRTTNEFGNIAQVFTSYESVAGTPTPEQQRGINSIQLVNESGRWWIMGISWEEESQERQIPAKYLSMGAK